jgi:methionyl-tRNA formyltransferase
VKIAVASSSEVSLPVLSFLVAHQDHDLQLVITNPDKATGRGRVVVPNAVASWCDDHKVNVSKPMDSQELASILDKESFDLLITVAYGHILKEDLLNKPRYGAINLHYSLLPKYRGAAPVQHAILKGDQITGVTVFKLDAGMDSGPIYLQKELAIEPEETTEDLIDRLNLVGVELIDQTLQLIIEGAHPKPQAEADVSFAPKFSKDNGQINWQSPAVDIFNQFRALGNNPGVFTSLAGEKIKIAEIKMVSTQSLAPGAFSVIDDSLLVGTKTSDLMLKNLIPEGRKVMSGKDFFNGLREKVNRSFA